MTSITTRAQRGARAWRPRGAALPVTLLLVAPLLGIIFAAVYFGMRARTRAIPLSAADVAAVPVRTAELEHTPNRRAALLASLRPTSGRALTGTAAIAVAVILASTAAAGSYAILNSRASMSASTVVLTAGTLGLTVNGSSSSTPVGLPAGFAKMLPGDYYSQSITVSNSGNTPGDISVRLAAAPAPYEVRLSAAACPTTGYTTAPTGTVLSTADTAFGQLAGGGTATGCLQIGLLTTAPAANNTTATVSAQTPSANATLTFTATQPSS